MERGAVRAGGESSEKCPDVGATHHGSGGDRPAASTRQWSGADRLSVADRRHGQGERRLFRRPPHLPCRRRYAISTEAPASSSWDLIESASSWATPSLTGFGAESTRSFASLRPSPVIARTTLITWIFCCPAPVRTTSNSVFSSAAGAPPSAPAAAATATGAAAVIPHSSSILFLSSTSSSTVMLPSCSKTVSTAAISMPPACQLWIRVLPEPPRRPRPPAAPRAATPPQVRARAQRLRAGPLLLRAPCLPQAPLLPRAEPPPREPRPRRPAPPAARSGRRSARRGSAAVR